MADAKITLTTEAKNEGLEKLQKALAEGQQSVVAMTKELKDLEKATRSGTQATQEQLDAMVKLRSSINAQKAENSAFAKAIGRTTAEIKSSVKAMADGDKGARALAGSFRLTEGFTSAFSTASGVLALRLLYPQLSEVWRYSWQQQQLLPWLSLRYRSVPWARRCSRA